MIDTFTLKKPQVYSTPYESLKLKERESDFYSLLVDKTMELENEIKKFILFKVKNKIDVDDIFQDVVMMLSTKDYLDIPDEIPIRSFIFSRVSIMIKRYFHQKSIDNKMLYLIDDNDKYANISTTESVEEYTEKAKTVFSREEIYSLLKSLEGRRYKYKYDIYLILYLRLIVNFDDTRFIQALAIVTGGDKKSLQACYTDVSKDQEIDQLLKMIVANDKASEVIEEFIYGEETIKSMLGIQMKLA